MDENKNENSPMIGDTYMSLDTETEDIYYKVIGVKPMVRTTGETILEMQGVHTGKKMNFPLLFLDKYFVKVNQTTVEILFGRKGKENGTTNDDKKS